MSGFFLNACQPKKEEGQSEKPRPIKPYIIKDKASGQILKYAAVTESSKFSSLSFPVSGTVKEVNVDLGQQVSKGNVLVKLDPDTFIQNVYGAKAEVGRINSDLKAKSLELERQEKLFKKGWVSQATIDQLESAYISAKKSVEYAQSKLNESKRHLKDTELKAPYDGIINARMIEPYQNVQPGQTVLEISGQIDYKLVFSIPETSLNLVQKGMDVEVSFSSIKGVYQGRIIELAQSSQKTGHYTAKAKLKTPLLKLKSGMSAEVTIFVDQEHINGFLIPVTALVLQDNNDNPGLYIFRKDTQTIELVSVEIIGARGNRVITNSPNLKSGMIIVAAGVSFLSNHQKVRLPDQYKE